MGKLQFRTPGHSVKSFEGDFRQVDDWSVETGFVVSDFLGDNFWVFEPGLQTSNQPVKHQPIEYTQEVYLDLATGFLQEIQESGIAKAVFSRIKSVPREVALQIMFEELLDAYPRTLVYLFEDTILGTWIGASPEILLRSEDAQTFEVMSLAGTKSATDGTPWGEKEILEQKYVTDFILDELRKDWVKHVQVNERCELEAGPVKHLCNRITFQKAQHTEISGVLKGLHPTPAVSGLPRLQALDLITKIERHQRKLYAGMVGWVSNESIDLYVNLRCAEELTGHLFLYVGGGFTKDSNPLDEWLETERKSLTLEQFAKLKGSH